MVQNSKLRLPNSSNNLEKHFPHFPSWTFILPLRMMNNFSFIPQKQQDETKTHSSLAHLHRQRALRSSTSELQRILQARQPHRNRHRFHRKDGKRLARLWRKHRCWWSHSCHFRHRQPQRGSSRRQTQRRSWFEAQTRPHLRNARHLL